MTVNELIQLLGSLPREYGDSPVMLGGGPHMPLCRVMITIPREDFDPAGRRVELRSALAYGPPPESRFMDEDGWCDDDIVKPAAGWYDPDGPVEPDKAA